MPSSKRFPKVFTLSINAETQSRGGAKKKLGSFRALFGSALGHLCFRVSVSPCLHVNVRWRTIMVRSVGPDVWKMYAVREDGPASPIGFLPKYGFHAFTVAEQLLARSLPNEKPEQEV
jgi:hypothetical protein